MGPMVPCPVRGAAPRDGSGTACHRQRAPSRTACHGARHKLATVTDNGSALLTDHYELTMVSAALRDGTATRSCVFEVFAGSARIVDLLAEFRFDDADVDFLRSTGVVDDATAEWLAGYVFTGDVTGY